MINYPLTPTEGKVVNWTGRVITAAALAMIALLGGMTFAAI